MAENTTGPLDFLPIVFPTSGVELFQVYHSSRVVYGQPLVNVPKEKCNKWICLQKPAGMK